MITDENVLIKQSRVTAKAIYYICNYQHIAEGVAS